MIWNESIIVDVCKQIWKLNLLEDESFWCGQGTNLTVDKIKVNFGLDNRKRKITTDKKKKVEGINW